MKSLNSLARKDIIKFPTAKFVLSLSLLPSLFVSSSSGFDDTPSLFLSISLRIIKKAINNVAHNEHLSRCTHQHARFTRPANVK